MNHKCWVLVWTGLALAGCEPESKLQSKHSDQQLAYFAGSLLRFSDQVTDVQYTRSSKLNAQSEAADQAMRADAPTMVHSFSLKIKYHPSSAASSTQPAVRQVKFQQGEDHHPDSPRANPLWLSIAVRAVERDQPSLSATSTRFIVDHNSPSAMGAEQYRFMQIPTHQLRFGLVKFAPHPQWVRQDGYQRTHDLYLDYAPDGQVRSYIQCDNRQQYAMASQCKMYWRLAPMLNADIQLVFLRSELQDWQSIRLSAERKILAMLVRHNG